VSVYFRGELICDAPRLASGGFRDQQSAKDHKRAKLRWQRSYADQIAALAQMRKARSGWMPPATIEPGNAPVAGAGALPMPRVSEPVRPAAVYPKPEKAKSVSAEQVRRAAAQARRTGTG